MPAEGQSLVDGLPDDIREMTRAVLASARAGDVAAMGIGLDESLKRQMFCNDMDEAQARFVLERCGAEAPSVFDGKVSRRGIPPALPKTYLRLLQDQSLAPDVQEVQIENLPPRRADP